MLKHTQIYKHNKESKTLPHLGHYSFGKNIHQSVILCSQTVKVDGCQMGAAVPLDVPIHYFHKATPRTSFVVIFYLKVYCKMNTVHFIAHYEKNYNNKDREIKMCVIKVAFLHK